MKVHNAKLAQAALLSRCAEAARVHLGAGADDRAIRRATAHSS